MERTKMTTLTLKSLKAAGKRITMLTAYDYPTALAIDRAGIDAILVGDSLGMVVLGYESTVPVTLDEMLHHCRAVARGAKHCLLVGDLPFLTYHVSDEQAILSAGRMLKEGGMDAVKLEGGVEMAPRVRAVVSAGIPVVGHIGLTPQTASQLGGLRVQGRDAAAAAKLIDDAKAIEAAGAFAIVLECIPDRLAALITKELSIPTIGIGAGAGCDGQVLVTHDLLGMFDRFTPRFVRQYAQLGKAMEQAFVAYRDDVQSGAFPGPEHAFSMKDEELAKLLASRGGA